jgi:hypothetical protein
VGVVHERIIDEFGRHQQTRRSPGEKKRENAIKNEERDGEKNSKQRQEEDEEVKSNLVTSSR